MRRDFNTLSVCALLNPCSVIVVYKVNRLWNKANIVKSNELNDCANGPKVIIKTRKLVAIFLVI